MELVERYLLAVRTWLPEELREDVMKELRGDLEAELAERAAAAARPLGAEEIEEVLRRRGHPLEVAGAYLPTRHLVGPALYPAYRLAVAGLVLGVLVPAWVLVMGPLSVLTGSSPGEALLDGFWGLVRAAVYAVGLVTLLFAALERWQVKAPFLGRWGSGTLLALPALAPAPASRARAAVALVITVVLTAAFLDVVWTGAFELQGVRVELAAGWPLVRWLVLSVALVGIAAEALKVAFPGAWRLHAAVELVDLLGAAALAGGLLAAGRLAFATGPASADPHVEWLQAALDRGVRATLVGVVVVCLVLAALEVRRWWRAERRARAGSGG